MKKVIKMKDLVAEGRQLQDKLTTKINERGDTPWGMVKPEIDPQTGLIYANDIPLTIEDCMELYDIYTKTMRTVAPFGSHHPGIQIEPSFEIAIQGQVDAHRFDGRQIKTLYDFAMRNRQRVASRSDFTGGIPKQDMI
jgi:hypothetical protein